MSLRHRKYAGFFPFDPITYSIELATGVSLGGSLFSMPISPLAIFFWTAKSVAITFSLSYINTGGGATDTGTISGTGTFTNSLLAVTEAQRTIISNFGNDGLALLDLTSTGVPITVAGIYNDGVNPPSPYSYTPSPVGMTWFNSLNSIGASFASYPKPGDVAFDQGSKKWFTRLFTLFNYGHGQDCSASTDETFVGPSGPPTNQFPGLFHFQKNGVDVSVPTDLILYCPNSFLLTTTSMTGSITINFNGFWTP